jgi:hypothetical protein
MTQNAIQDIEINFFAYYIEDIENNISIIELNERGNVTLKELRPLKDQDEGMTL